MSQSVTRRPRRVLIASANPLFREGLRKVYARQWGATAEVVGTPSSLAETLAVMESLRPDLVIIDHDDRAINREEFLSRFVSGHASMKVVLVSLDEAGQAVVYDRRKLDTAQAEDWLNNPWIEEDLALENARRQQARKERRRNMRHFVIAAILVILASVLTYGGLQAAHLLPAEASAESVPIDRLWNQELAVISFLFALIVVPMGYSLVAFRRKRGETGDGVHMEGDTRLEVTWTVLPLFLVLAFAYLGAQTLTDIQHVDPQAVSIEVTGSQWNWRFNYPEYGGFTSDTLYLPVGRQVVLRMQSLDVIHSFWVPEFRIKQDLLPGRVTEYRVTPTELGSYKVRCAELCGLKHSIMEASVIVVPEALFRSWASNQQISAAATEQASPGHDPVLGQKYVAQYGCGGCHSIDGTKGKGPTWRGLFGSIVQLTGGDTVTADESYLTQSIKTPAAQIVAGFVPGMPTFPLTDKQISDIVAYIQTLK